MNALWWVMVVTVAVGVGVFGAGYDHRGAVVVGMAGPLLVSAVSWTMTTRTWAREQAAVLPLMLRAFAVKALFFVAYVAVMLAVFEVRLRPFVLSLTVTFLATHLAEAYCLRQLMAPVLGFSRR